MQTDEQAAGLSLEGGQRQKPAGYLVNFAQNRKEVNLTDCNITVWLKNVEHAPQPLKERCTANAWQAQFNSTVY